MSWLQIKVQSYCKVAWLVTFMHVVLVWQALQVTRYFFQDINWGITWHRSLRRTLRLQSRV
jgi:hypothetical protein